MDGPCHSRSSKEVKHRTGCKDVPPIGLRRSTRFANKPYPSYAQVYKRNLNGANKPSLGSTKVSEENLDRASRYHNQQRDLSNGVCQSTEARMHPKKLAPKLTNGSNAGEPESTDARMHPKKLAPKLTNGSNAGEPESSEARMHPRKLEPKLTNGSNAGEPIEICEEAVVNDPKTPMFATPQQPKREMSEIVIGEVVPEVDKGLESFTIVVNGLIIGSDLSTSVKTKYYKLCSSQKTPLHANLESLNFNFILGAICETVDIADAIKGVKPCSSEDDIAEMEKRLAAWEKSLEALDKLGMNVRFLCTRVQKLRMIILEMKQALALSKEMALQQVNINNEITTKKRELDELEKAFKSLDSKRMGLIGKSRAYANMLRSEVDSPW